MNEEKEMLEALRLEDILKDKIRCMVDTYEPSTLELVDVLIESMDIGSMNEAIFRLDNYGR